MASWPRPGSPRRAEQLGHSLLVRRSSSTVPDRLARPRPPRGGVDHREAPGLARRQLQEAVADAAMEGEVEFGFEARHLARCLARQADLRRHVEQDRQVGLESVGRRLLQRLQAVQRAPRRRIPGRPASNRRTGRTARSCRTPRAGRMTWPTSWRRAALNNSASVVASVGTPAPVWARRTSRRRSPSQRAARLARDEDVVSPACQEGCRAIHLRGLPGAFRAFERDEPATAGQLGRIDTPASVADDFARPGSRCRDRMRSPGDVDARLPGGGSMSR